MNKHMRYDDDNVYNSGRSRAKGSSRSKAGGSARRGPRPEAVLLTRRAHRPEAVLLPAAGHLQAEGVPLDTAEAITAEEGMVPKSTESQEASLRP